MDKATKDKLAARIKLTTFTANEFRRQGDEEEYELWMERVRALEQLLSAAGAPES
jgi:hypothetical protein